MISAVISAVRPDIDSRKIAYADGMEASTQTANGLSGERKALIAIAGRCLAALDPELERTDLIAVLRDLYAISSDFPDPDGE